MWKIIFALCTLMTATSFAREGRFCNRFEQVIEYVCGYYPGGYGWVNNPTDNCYHRDTGQYCPNSSGWDYPLPAQPGYPTHPGYPDQPGYGATCGPGWQSMGQFTCINRQEHQRICGCRPEGFNNPSLWNDEHNGCYNHVTGRTCRY